MPRRTGVEDDWEDDEDDFDSSDDDDDTVPCPYCKRPIHEEAERCPYCESYISEEDAPPKLKPWWIVLGIVLCLLIVLMWIMSGW